MKRCSLSGVGHEDLERGAIKTVIFLIAGKLDFHAINPHARQPT
jgi:hypothetical protein